MMKKIALTFIVASSLLTACAEKSANIEPAAISANQYDGWTCKKLKSEQEFVEDALVRVSADQDKAASNDALMVFLIGIPTSGGGVEGEVARLKGEKEALRQAIRDKDC